MSEQAGKGLEWSFTEMFRSAMAPGKNDRDYFVRSEARQRLLGLIAAAEKCLAPHPLPDNFDRADTSLRRFAYPRLAVLVPVSEELVAGVKEGHDDGYLARHLARYAAQRLEVANVGLAAFKDPDVYLKFDWHFYAFKLVLITREISKIP